MNLNEIYRIVTEHPELEELNLPYNNFAADDAIVLIRRLDMLQEFEVQLKKSEYTDLMSQLDDDEWTVTIDDESPLDDDHICSVV